MKKILINMCVVSSIVFMPLSSYAYTQEDYDNINNNFLKSFFLTRDLDKPLQNGSIKLNYNITFYDSQKQAYSLSDVVINFEQKAGDNTTTSVAKVKSIIKQNDSIGLYDINYMNGKGSVHVDNIKQLGHYVDNKNANIKTIVNNLKYTIDNTNGSNITMKQATTSYKIKSGKVLVYSSILSQISLTSLINKLTPLNPFSSVYIDINAYKTLQSTKSDDYTIKLNTIIDHKSKLKSTALVIIPNSVFLESKKLITPEALSKTLKQDPNNNNLNQEYSKILLKSYDFDLENKGLANTLLLLATPALGKQALDPKFLQKSLTDNINQLARTNKNIKLVNTPLISRSLFNMLIKNANLHVFVEPNKPLKILDLQNIIDKKSANYLTVKVNN